MFAVWFAANDLCPFEARVQFALPKTAILVNVYACFHLKKKGNFAHCSCAAQSTPYKIWLSEEKAMFLMFLSFEMGTP